VVHAGTVAETVVPLAGRVSQIFAKLNFFHRIQVREILFARKVLGYRYRFAVADFPFSALNEHHFLCFYYGARPRRPF
jgi:hypothetical protein